MTDFAFGPCQTRWLEALESDKFPQTNNTLRRKDTDGHVTGYCCLGVAVEVCNLLEQDDLSLAHTYFNVGLRDREGYSDSYAPELYADLELLRPGMWGRERRGISLTMLNDAGVSFKDIARLLRKYATLWFTGPQ